LQPSGALNERRDFVAKAEHAARLEADKGNCVLEERGERSHTALSLAPRLVDEPDCEEGAPAAERPPSAVGRFRQMHRIAAGGEHGERGLDVLRLEVAVEGVGKEHDRPWFRCAGKARWLAPCIGTPARQAPPRAQARVALRPLPQARRVIAQVGEPRPFGRERRVAR